jgi:hypothetical protein
MLCKYTILEPRKAWLKLRIYIFCTNDSKITDEKRIRVQGVESWGLVWGISPGFRAIIA